MLLQRQLGKIAFRGTRSFRTQARLRQWQDAIGAANATQTDPRIIFRRRQQTEPVRALQPTNAGVWIEMISPVTGNVLGQQWVDALWLRDRCTCEACVDPKTHQKSFSTASIDETLRCENFSQEGPYVNIEWIGSVGSETHVSRYLTSEVWNARRDAADHVASTGYSPWARSDMESIVASGSNTVDYNDYINSEEAFAKSLTALRDQGLLFVTGVPRSEESAEKIAERIGPLRHTFYGRTFDVKDKPNAENVAYTSGDLELHMDLLYMKQPPGLQLLHCINVSGSGGVSTFSDAFKAANLLWQDVDARHAFRTLATYPVSYHYRHPGKAFFDTKPTFEINTASEEFKTALGKNGDDMPQLKNVNWSPPFQAPFTADPELPGGAKFRIYQRAATAFSQLVNEPSMKYERLLQPGECVIFNNRRVLHGRTSFTSGTEERFLKGCYLDIDDFESHLRQRQLLEGASKDARVQDEKDITNPLADLTRPDKNGPQEAQSL